MKTIQLTPNCDLTAISLEEAMSQARQNLQSETTYLICSEESATYVKEQVRAYSSMIVLPVPKEFLRGQDGWALVFPGRGVVWSAGA